MSTKKDMTKAKKEAKTGVKKPAHSGTGNEKNKSGTKRTDTVPVKNDTGATEPPEYLYDSNSPQALEDKWLKLFLELIKKKKMLDESDKFTENLCALYDDLLEQLSIRCKEKFKPVFRTIDGTSHNSSQQADEKPRSIQVEETEKKLKDQLDESAKQINGLKDENKNLKNELDVSKLAAKTLNAMKDENEKLKKENDNLEKKLKGFENQIKVNPNNITENSVDLHQKLTNQEKNLTQRNKRIDELETEKSNLLKEVGDLKNRFDESEKNLTTLNKDIKKVQTELDEENEKRKRLERENEDLKRMQDTLRTQLDKMESTTKSHGIDDKQVTRLTGENERLKTNEKNLEQTISKMEASEKNLQNTIKALTEEKNGLEHIVNEIKTQVRQEVDHHTKKTETLSKDLMSREHELLDLKRSKSEIERSQSSMQKQIDDQTALIKRLEEEKNKLKKEKKSATKGPDQKLKDLEEENEKLRDRLSQIAGSKLTDGNPAIADLGDPNRPTQLGEKFSELYDNEWTDAMEELTNAGDEKANISTLRSIVEKSYEFGKTRAADYVKGLEEALLKINNSIQVTPEISKLIKEHRKNIAVVVADSLHHTFLSSYTEYKVGGEGVKKFIRKTVTLCWLMAIQDPPVILTTKMSGKFDTDRFRHYTKSGSTVDYVVWPVVFLHEGGPIICKGVAQGK